MQKMRDISRRAIYWIKVVSLGLILGAGLQFVQAWIAPTANPPAGNVAGPITTGSVDQVKTAGLGLAGDLVVGAAAPAVPQKICLNGVCITEWPTSRSECVPTYQVDNVAASRSANVMYKNNTSDTLTWIIAVGAGRGFGGWPQYGQSNMIDDPSNTEHFFIDNGTVYTFSIPAGHYYGISSHGDPRYATVNSWQEGTMVCR